jgi:hypothetical protein
MLSTGFQLLDRNNALLLNAHVFFRTLLNSEVIFLLQHTVVVYDSFINNLFSGKHPCLIKIKCIKFVMVGDSG